MNNDDKIPDYLCLGSASFLVGGNLIAEMSLQSHKEYRYHTENTVQQTMRSGDFSK
jgi:hypothetical protein